MSPVVAFARDLPCHPPELPVELFSHAWLEGWEGAKLAFFPDGAAGREVYADYPAGRLFGEKGEYRWQSSPNHKIQAVILLEEGEPPAGFQGRLELAPMESGETALMLWGDWVDPEKDPLGNPKGEARFYARELPRIQDYPISVVDLSTIKRAVADKKIDRRVTVPPARLKVRRYRHPAAGEFLRCAGVMVMDDVSQEGNDAKD